MALKWIRNQKGQALVESALVLPIILLLLLGMVELGRVSNAYLAVMHAARHGARYGAVGATNDEIISRVLSSAAHLDSTNLTVLINPESGRQSGQDIKVTVTYPITMLTPLTGSIFTEPITVRSDITMLVE
ncbi:MAG: TadE/TadG family type IV pilus assembly protein [Bacillota bacterium]|nr:TadE/TadG family type IV pilus assembly protein [Bacillota bacterium]MDW7683944.1 TadE/TadG family type IV pilus assembly protein [Bacillota bacterium]